MKLSVVLTTLGASIAAAQFNVSTANNITVLPYPLPIPPPIGPPPPDGAPGIGPPGPPGPPGAPWTVLTICAQTTVTITSCAPTVNNCPAKSLTPYTTVTWQPVTTTSCPLASISSVISALPPGQTVVIPAPPPPVNVTVAPPPPATTAPSITAVPYKGSANMVAGSVGAVLAGIVAAMVL